MAWETLPCHHSFLASFSEGDPRTLQRPTDPGYFYKAEVRRVIDAYTLMLAEPRTGTTTPETGNARVRYLLAVPIDPSPCIGAPVWVAA